ncbi:acyclic terpene utilization AtuA family protein [Solimonas sp. SE-A11]|uniref:acyclic terpene utilization AtuA family protein n=1 Tax=Solimonas sp. SE-A11 TaxID=3054954 RepID=UPI00259D2366|nr:acyclic terpene utilization AtuA family protein [Solimonas sp. SE-A11]MDM4772172.1 acyclic terpene utilization AtuA family protein [Solimonas sp. SE-A11]
MKTVRIGCASAFWGDTNAAAAQLVEKGGIDYLVFDYLAEITMSILAAKRMKDPNDGYATDFVEHVMAPLMARIKEKGIRVVANAGGVNPLACKKALEEAAAKAGLSFRVGVVLGDELNGRRKDFADCTELGTGKPLPPVTVSMNAYLGAIPIAKALEAGAEIVITGRCVDSAVVLGPLMHEFGWQPDDYDRLAAGSIAGHIIECGAQCTGGNFTDWELVRGGYADMGFPIVEMQAGGEFTVTKPEGTGGLVSPHTVLEQMLYEIGDPRAYLLPDVTCDFTQVKLEQAAPDVVRVSGCRGHAPTDSYKVSATYPAGMRCAALFMIGGIDAARKGRASAQGIVEKVRRQLLEAKLGDFSGVDIHCIGAEESYGPHARAAATATREVVVKIAVQHPNPKALKLFAREIAQAATGMAPGFTGYFGAGRPEPHMVPRLFSTLVPKERVAIEVVVGEERLPVGVPLAGGFAPPPAEAEVLPDLDMAAAVPVPLIRLALARSGDKGDHANIGVIARRPEYLPYLRAALSTAALRRHFAHVLAGGEGGRVERWELPGTNSLNFLLHNALGGGGAGSLRTDPQGKAFGQMLLDFLVPVPPKLLVD